MLISISGYCRGGWREVGGRDATHHPVHQTAGLDNPVDATTDIPAHVSTQVFPHVSAARQGIGAQGANHRKP